MGSILRVNLSDGTISTERPDETFYRRYFGGWGFIGYYLLKELADDKEPQKLLRKKYDQGDYGAKTGRGFYDWSKKSLEKMTARQNKRFIDRLRELRKK